MTSATLPPTRPAVSAFLKEQLGGRPEVRAYYDDNGDSAVAIVEAVGTPHPELTTYATSSLHATENLLEDRDVRVELLIVGKGGDAALGNVLATAAFNVMKDGWLAAPGVVFPNLVAEYFPTVAVKHVMWSTPFDFDDLASFNADGVGQPIHALQAVPITDAEFDLLRAQGLLALERTLTQAEVDHFDLTRTSAVGPDHS